MYKIIKDFKSKEKIKEDIEKFKELKKTEKDQSCPLCHILGIIIEDIIIDERQLSKTSTDGNEVIVDLGSYISKSSLSEKEEKKYLRLTHKITYYCKKCKSYYYKIVDNEKEIEKE